MAEAHLSHDEVWLLAPSLSHSDLIHVALMITSLSSSGSSPTSSHLERAPTMAPYTSSRRDVGFPDQRPVHFHAGSTNLIFPVTYNQDIPQPTPENPMPDLNPPSALPVLIRATNCKSKKNRAKKVKLSTVVNPGDLDAFYARYADTCKAGMTALKPRDRSKKKAKAKKKKSGPASAAAGNAG